MGILKDIWNTIFGKSKKQEEFGRGGSIEEPEMKVVYKKDEEKIKSGSTYTENELGEPNTQMYNEVQECVAPIDSQIKFEVSEPKAKRPYKERVKGMVMTKEQEVLQYLLKYGSIDKRTCAEKFGLKRLDNVICELRKQGMNIKNETVELHNELGEKTKVNNYRLVTSDGAN
jgi:hypothetical protein